MNRRVLLLTNPAARRGAAWHTRAVDAVRATGATCDAIVTERAGHAREILGAVASQYDAVFSLGGDGTAIEVISALAGTGIPVGVLPGGTGNQLARSLGIPLDVRRAVLRLLSGRTRLIDLGCLARGRRFACTAGFGANDMMVAATRPALKRALGIGAYSIAALGVALRARPFDVRAVVDGRTIERRASLVMIANVGTIMSGMFAFGREIRPDDGMLDLCIFTPRSAGHALRIVWRMHRRDFRRDPSVVRVRGHEFAIETASPRLMQVDGELFDGTALNVRIEPRAALLVVPAA